MYYQLGERMEKMQACPKRLDQPYVAVLSQQELEKEGTRMGLNARTVRAYPYDQDRGSQPVSVRHTVHSGPAGESPKQQAHSGWLLCAGQFPGTGG